MPDLLPISKLCHMVREEMGFELHFPIQLSLHMKIDHTLACKDLDVLDTTYRNELVYMQGFIEAF